MKILFLCGREVEYPLNHFLIESLKRFSDVDVVYAKGPGKSILKRSLVVTLWGQQRLITGHYDLICVGFFGHFLMLPLGIFRSRPILFYPLISIHETLVFDRQRIAQHSLPAQIAFWIDKKSCSQANQIILDTQANIDHFSRTFSLPLEKFERIFVGSDERIFYPRPQSRRDGQVIVLYQGSYLPLHGVDRIIQAAQILKNHSHIRFRMIGRGMGYEQIYKLSTDLNLPNIEFWESIPQEKMPEVIADSDICLGGHFSRVDKALRVIAGKTYQDIAMGKPTIVGDTPANQELLCHNYDAWFSQPDDPEDLANGIMTLSDNLDLRLNIGTNARQTFMKKASLEVQTSNLRRIIETMVG